MKLFLCSVFIIFSLVGCSKDSIKQVDVYKLESFTSASEETLVTYTDKKVIKEIVTAVKKAKKQPGVVDMADPEYKLVIGKDSYFLWISEDSGTIMNTNDTHTIYSLPKFSAPKIYEILN